MTNSSSSLRNTISKRVQKINHSVSSRFNRTKPLITALFIGIITGFLLSHLTSSNDQKSEPSDANTRLRNTELYPMRDASVADELFERVRVLCWVMTTPENHETRARHVKATWGKRCNLLLFMSSEKDASLPTVSLPVREGEDYIWQKTKEAFKHVYEYYLNEADWFLKTDDDTYVIMENLRYMLQRQDPTRPVYYGCRLKPFVKQGFMSGGAGYVLSREAVVRFVELQLALPNSTFCNQSDVGEEDVHLGLCLQGVNVTAGDSRDSRGRERFFLFSPEFHMFPPSAENGFWYWKFMYYKAKKGFDCCSEHAVSFHYVNWREMYVYEYLLYRLRPYGILQHVHVPLRFAEHVKIGELETTQD